MDYVCMKCGSEVVYGYPSKARKRPAGHMQPLVPHRCANPDCVYAEPRRLEPGWAISRSKVRNLR